MISLFFKKFSDQKIAKKFLGVTLLFFGINGTIFAGLAPLVGNQPLTDQDKILQTRVIFQIDTLNLLLHRASSALANLKSLSKEQIKLAQEEISSLQTILEQIKDRNSFKIQRDQLIKSMMYLSELITSIEAALKNGFQALPQIEDTKLKKALSSPSFAPQEMEQILQNSEVKLRSFDRLISSMNLRWYNKAYIKMYDFWSTPLLSIPGLSGDGNRDIYLSSILKRCGIYGATLGLVVYNTPEGQIDKIPNENIRNFVKFIKSWVKDAPYIATESATEKGILVDDTPPTKQWKFGETPIATGDDNMPLFVNAAGEQVAVAFDGKTFNLNDHTDVYVELYGAIPAKIDAQSLNHLWFDGRIKVFKGNNHEMDWQHYSKQIQSEEGVLKETSPNQWVDGKTKQPIIVPGQNNQEKEQVLDALYIDVPRFTPQGSDFTHNGIPVNRDLIHGADNRQFPTERSISHKSDGIMQGDSIINWALGNVNWLVQISPALAFQWKLGQYLYGQVAQDAQTIQEDIPYVCDYVHRKLYGDDTEFSTKLQVSKTDFSDIIGREDIKAQLQDIIDFVSNPESFIQTKHQISRGYLLAGEPQTGKTSMVSALAGELTKAIQKRYGSNQSFKLFDVPVEWLLKLGIPEIMARAKQHAPCVLFFDEFDLTGPQRTENKTFLAEALTSIAGYTESKDVQNLIIFIIATNRPEHIDYAIHDYGRCGTVLYFENPYFDERKKYFEHFFTKQNLKLDTFDLDQIAQETEACSYGTLNRISNEISSVARKQNEVPSQKHVDIALDSIVKRIIPGAQQLPDDKREIMAARYGAKAFASVVLKPEKKLVGVTVSKITKKIEEKPVLHHYEVVNQTDVTGIKFGGIFRYNCNDTYGLISHEELIKECKIAIAGTVGQYALGLDYIGFPEDEEEALQIARKIAFNGCKPELFPKEVRKQKEMEAYLLVQECRVEMQQLLEDHKDNFKKLVDLLQRRNVIRVSDIKQCFGLHNLDIAYDYWIETLQQKRAEQDNPPAVVETPAPELDAITTLAAKGLIENTSEGESASSIK